jgi:hypothetical protein
VNTRATRRREDAREDAGHPENESNSTMETKRSAARVLFETRQADEDLRLAPKVLLTAGATTMTRVTYSHPPRTSSNAEHIRRSPHGRSSYILPESIIFLRSRHQDTNGHDSSPKCTAKLIGYDSGALVGASSETFLQRAWRERYGPTPYEITTPFAKEIASPE